jgi:hypothetical protein
MLKPSFTVSLKSKCKIFIDTCSLVLHDLLDILKAILVLLPVFFIYLLFL